MHEALGLRVGHDPRGCRRIEKVTVVPMHAALVETVGVVRAERVHLGATREEHLCERATDEAGCAGDEHAAHAWRERPASEGP